MIEQSRATLTIPRSNGNIVETRKAAAVQPTQNRNKVYRILGVLIITQVILWLADGRNRIYRQVSVDVPFSINSEHDYMKSMGFNQDYSNAVVAVLISPGDNKMGIRGIQELEKALVPFNATVRVVDSLPKNGMPDGESAIYYAPSWTTPLLARTDLTFMSGNVGASYWGHYHLYVLGFWFHLTGRSTGVS